VLRVLAFVVASFLACSAFAQTRGPDLRWGPWAGPVFISKETNVAGRNLRDSEIVAHDVSGSNFDDCDLTDTVFAQCNLKGSTFRRARLNGVFFDDCDVEGVDLTDADIRGMRDDSSEFTPEQVRATHSYKNKNLRGTRIYCGTHDNRNPGFDFRGFDLRDADLQWLVEGVDFTDADIQGATVAAPSKEQLESTKAFKNRALYGIETYLAEGSVLDGFYCVDCRFFLDKSVSLKNAEFARCTFYGRGFGNEQLYATKNYARGDLSGLTIQNATLKATNFAGQNLTGCALIWVDFAGADFTDAVITRAHFSALHHQTAITRKQLEKTWNLKQNRLEKIYGLPPP
jgi:uncharacterized protein YjbI with pentapeptide repeats